MTKATEIEKKILDLIMRNILLLKNLTSQLQKMLLQV